MRLIVVGGGRVGLAVLERATAENDRVTLVDIDPDRIQRARYRFGAINAVQGDATDDAVLKEAGAPDVDALIVATPDDPTNLMACAVAKRLGVQNVVARVSDGDSRSLFEEIGATPIKNPSHLTAEHLYHKFEVPGVRTFMPVGERGEVITLVLGPKSTPTNKPVKEADFPRDALLVAVNRGGRVLVPTGDLVLKSGDVLTLVADEHAVDQIVGKVLGRTGRVFAKEVRGLFRRG